jgi:(E)-4-hydroxy-3-methyl-but-2-enyl pyrophosphate reductase
MMRIVLSQHLSYCFGVQKTLTLVEDMLRENPGRAYTMLGHIVHNERVIQRLLDKGLRIALDPDGVEDGATVIIPSHGAPQSIFDRLAGRRLTVIDATCPMVKVIHRRAQKLEAEGFLPVIIGDPNHDEVKGIAGHVRRAEIVREPEDVTPERFAGVAKAGVVVQSTFIRADALAVLEAIRRIVPEVRFEDTICRPTTERQNEVQEEAGRYDCVLIVGSRTSANTRHLFELAGGKKASVYLVDDPSRIPEMKLAKCGSVFIASGASTPIEIIDRVVTLLEEREEKPRR